MTGKGLLGDLRDRFFGSVSTIIHRESKWVSGTVRISRSVPAEQREKLLDAHMALLKEKMLRHMEEA